MNALTLQNSVSKGLAVLIIDPNVERGQRTEALAEQDPHLSRMRVYVAPDLATGRDWARKYSCDLAIFPDGLDSRDFVNTQIELRHAQPSIGLVPILDTPSIAQLSESRKIGGIVDYGDVGLLDSYPNLRSKIEAFLRTLASPDQLSKMFTYADSHSRCLLSTRPDWSSIKTVSKEFINELVLQYDLSAQENAAILAAEQLYAPWLKPDAYITLLQPDPFKLAPILSETSSWEIGQSATAPRSPAGFLITLANYSAAQLAAHPQTEVIADILSRPQFLKHPAIRVVTRDLLNALFNTITNKQTGVASG